MTAIVSLDSFRAEAKKRTTQAALPYSLSLLPHEFHGAGGMDSLKPQFRAASLSLPERKNLRRWLAGTSYIPGAPTGRWFLNEGQAAEVYFERHLDKWRFDNRWGQSFTRDPDADRHNERVLARRFFDAACPENLPGYERILGKALLAKPGFRWDEIEITRRHRPYGESVMADTGKLRQIYLMWSGRTLAC